MKGKKVAQFTFSILIILFIALYTTQQTGYYENTKSKKTTLTDDTIKKKKKDVAEGKEISAKNYLVEEKNYNNTASQFGMKLSSLIEDGFNKAMNALFKEVEKAVNSK